MFRKYAASRDPKKRCMFHDSFWNYAFDTELWYLGGNTGWYGNLDGGANGRLVIGTGTPSVPVVDFSYNRSHDFSLANNVIFTASVYFPLITSVRFAIGLRNGSWGGSTSHCFFVYDSTLGTTWRMSSDNGSGTPNVADMGGTAVAATTQYQLKIATTSTTADFFVLGSDSSAVSGQTTTKLPTVSLDPILRVQAANGIARSLQCSYIACEQDRYTNTGI